MDISTSENYARMARRGRKLMPYLVLLAILFQSGSILISVRRAFDAGHVHGLHSVAQLWEVSQAYERGQEAFTRFDVYIRSQMLSSIFGIERIVIFGVFCLAMIPLLRIIENACGTGTVALPREESTSADLKAKG